MPEQASGAVSIRNARTDEAEAVANLTRAAYAEYAQVMEPAAWEGLRRAVEDGLAAHERAQCIVAVLDRRLVGSVMLFPPQADSYGDAIEALTWPEVRLLAVSPDARGSGIGRALMLECIRRARSIGATHLGIHTSRSMVAALEMYRKLGFVRTPQFDFQPPGAEVVEAYTLPL